MVRWTRMETEKREERRGRKIRIRIARIENEGEIEIGNMIETVIAGGKEEIERRETEADEMVIDPGPGSYELNFHLSPLIFLPVSCDNE